MSQVAQATQPSQSTRLRVDFSMQCDATFAVMPARWRSDVVDVLHKHNARFKASLRKWICDVSVHDTLCADMTLLSDVDIRRMPAEALHSSTAVNRTIHSTVVINAENSGAQPSVSASSLSDSKHNTLRSASAPKTIAGDACRTKSEIDLPPASLFTPTAADIAMRIHPTLRNFMTDFQLRGVEYVLRRGGRALIADEMGCGKTTTAIAIAAHYRETWPLLVICPPGLRFNWRAELLSRLRCEGFCEEDVAIINSGRDALPFAMGLAARADTQGGHAAQGAQLDFQKPAVNVGSAPRKAAKRAGSAALADDATYSLRTGIHTGVIIMSYDMVPTFVDSGVLRPGLFKFVICDESHMLKTGDAKRTRACLPLCRTATHVLLLSGTPALNRPKELYTQISAINPRLFPDYRAFATRYCNARDCQWGWDDTGSSNATELSAILTRELMLRRLKADVLKELPPKRRIVVQVDMPLATERKLQDLRADIAKVSAQMRTARDVDRDALSLRNRGLMATLFQVTGVGKLNAILAHLLALIEPLEAVGAWEAEAAADEKRRREIALTRTDGSSLADDRGVRTAIVGGKRSRFPRHTSTGTVATNIPIKSKLADKTVTYRAPSYVLPDDNEDDITDLTVGDVGLSPGAIMDHSADGMDNTFNSSGGVGFIVGDDKEDTADSCVDAGLPPGRHTSATASPSKSAHLGKNHASGGLRVRKVVVFAHHAAVLEAVEQGLTGAKPPIRCVRIDGSTNPAHKHRLTCAFQEDPSIQVAIVGITAAGVGLTFTAANVAVFAELHWTPGILFQAFTEVPRNAMVPRGASQPSHAHNLPESQDIAADSRALVATTSVWQPDAAIDDDDAFDFTALAAAELHAVTKLTTTSH